MTKAIAFILGVFLGVFIFWIAFPSTDKIVSKYEAKEAQNKAKFELFQKEVLILEKKNEGFISIIQVQEKEISSLGEKLDKKVPYKIKKIIVNKVEYVEKKDYASLYDLSLKLKDSVKKYKQVVFDLTINHKDIVNKYKEIIVNKDIRIGDAREAIFKLQRKLKRKFSLVVGVGADHRGNFGLQATFGIRVL